MAISVLTNMSFHGSDSAGSLLISQTIRLFYLTILLIVTLHGQICTAQLALPVCNRAVQYSNGSQFERNLNTVFDSLLQRTNQTGFNISVSGESPDRIYGLLQCRADMTVHQCYNCSQLAVTSIRQICRNAVGASVWYYHCFVRYENYSFIGNMSTDVLYVYYDVNISNPDGFSTVVKKLLDQLSAEAAPGTKRSAFGTTVDSFSRKIYGLVQCTRDLSTKDCTGCLSLAILNIFTTNPGKQGVRVWGQGCIVRYQIFPFFNSTALPPPPPETPRISNTDKRSNKTPIILGVVGSLVLVLILCVLVTMRRLKSAMFTREYEVEEDTAAISDGHGQIVYTMETLLAATNNFHVDTKLGEGGFGPVYKGTVPGGKEIAVKKLSLKSMQGRREFLNEVRLMTQIQHRNLVNLLGCCTEGSERLVVYEYLPNNSLDKILFDPNKRIQLDWQKRYNIILGVARGLHYLHQESQLRIVHRDIKASNILLDENLNPKISDFGLARLFPEDETHVMTRVAGTYGYMAPEYGLHGQLSVKADVYSFGVLLLELVTGRKNTDYNLSPEMHMLLGWAWRLYEGGNIEQMIDRAIIETCDEQQALRCIHVGLLCTQVDSSLRPPMSRVIMVLSTDYLTTLPDPTKPIVFAVNSIAQNTESTSSGFGMSHARRTTSSPSSFTGPITELVPR